MRRRLEWLRGVFFGWLFGSTLMLMWAPRTGEESLSMLREKVSQLSDNMMDRYQSARQRADEITRSSTGYISDVSQQSLDRINQQKILIQSTLTGVREGVRAYQEGDRVSQSSMELSPVGQQTKLSTHVLDPNDLDL
jgi:gas vesicle protein